MSFLYNCPLCKSGFDCQEEWAGQQIKCPSCQNSILIPGRGGRLSVSSAPAHSAAPAKSPVPAPMFAPLTQTKKKSWVDIAKPVATVLVVLALAGAGVYFGPQLYKKYVGKKSDDGKTAAAEAAATNAPPPPPKPVKKKAVDMPVIPPEWTLDVTAAEIPKARLNGTISGTEFILDAAKMAKNGAMYLLHFRQGKDVKADREIFIYLQTKAGDKVEGGSWTIAKDTRGAPRIIKQWQTGPGRMGQKQFAAGYAMKLQLGKIKDGEISGKLFLALPDPEKTVIAGEFDATTPIPAGGAAPSSPIQ